MAASTSSLLLPLPSSSPPRSIKAPSFLHPSSLSSFPIVFPPTTLLSLSSSHKVGPSRGPLLPRRRVLVAPTAALGKLSEAELFPIPREPGDLEGKFPSGAGVYGIYDKDGALQFVGISRNIAASIAAHAKFVPAELCCSVKVELVGEAELDKTVLTDAWKEWMEEHIAMTGKVPPGNQSGNNTWVRRPTKKPDLRLTPGRHVQLTVSLEELIDRVVKDNKVVAFIKGSRSAPQCGFSQRVVGILESHKIDFESVDILDEEHNYGLKETLKKYSNWPTFPQVFVKGELVGGCDIISSMAETGEIATLFQD